jgi:hypothetical protein
MLYRLGYEDIAIYDAAMGELTGDETVPVNDSRLVVWNVSIAAWGDNEWARK